MSKESENQPTRVLLLGATGLTGGHCLNLLLEDPRPGMVYALNRRQIELKHPRLKQFVADPLTELPDEAFTADVAICCLGTTRKKAGSAARFRAIDLDLPAALAARARDAGVKDFVLVSSLGANSGALSLYSRTKGELEEAIEKLDFDRFIIARPSLLLGNRAESRLLEDLGQRAATPFAWLTRHTYPNATPIPAEQLARALVNAALTPGPAGPQILHYAELTQLAGPDQT